VRFRDVSVTPVDGGQPHLKNIFIEYRISTDKETAMDWILVSFLVLAGISMAKIYFMFK